MRQAQNLILGLSLPWLAAALPATAATAADKEEQSVKIGNANHIFNSIHDSMRQFGSSLNHNGMGVFVATVPENTEFYHGTKALEPVNGTQWLAFEPEHAMIFARARGPPPGYGGPGRRPGGGPPGEGPPGEGPPGEGPPGHGPPPGKGRKPKRIQINREGRPCGGKEKTPSENELKAMPSPMWGQKKGDRPDRHDGPPSPPGGGRPDKKHGPKPPPRSDRPDKKHGPPGGDRPDKHHGPPREDRPDKHYGPPPPPEGDRPDKHHGPPGGDRPDKYHGPPSPPGGDRPDKPHGRPEPPRPGHGGVPGRHGPPPPPHGGLPDKHHGPPPPRGNGTDGHDGPPPHGGPPGKPHGPPPPHGGPPGKHHGPTPPPHVNDTDGRRPPPPHGGRPGKHHGSPPPDGHKPGEHDGKSAPPSRGIIGAFSRLFFGHQQPIRENEEPMAEYEVADFAAEFEAEAEILDGYDDEFDDEFEYEFDGEFDGEFADQYQAEDRDEDRSPGYLHTYRTKHALRLLYLDGQSAAKSNKGTLDVQDMIIRNTSSPGNNRGMMGENERADEMCRIAHEEYDDQIDGILRMEGGFEVILCSFAAHLDVVRIMQAAPSTGGGPGGNAEDQFSYYEAVAARYYDIGAERVALDYDNMVTLFAYPGAIYFDDTGRPRVQNDSASNMALVRTDIENMALGLTSPDRALPTQSINWQAVTDQIVTRYADRIEYMASGSLTTLSTLRAEAERAIRPFIDYSDRSESLESQRCTTQFLPSGLQTSTVAGWAVKQTYTTLCSSLAAVAHAEDYERAVSIVANLKEYLGWTTWKRCRGCAVNEICMLPIWPIGSAEDFVQPRCVSAETMGEHRGDYWGGFGPRPKKH